MTQETPRTVTLDIEGMSCGHCQQAVEDALANVDGVETVEVVLDEGRADVTASASTGTDALVAAVEAQGYEVRPS